MYEYWNIDWLAHHGIEGQRWGRRNGPPYPLSNDVSTGQRLKKQTSGSIKKKKSSKSDRVTNKFIEKAVNDNQDMFNDLLYNVKYGSDKEKDTKSYEKALKAVAKENGVNWKDLKKDVEQNFDSREKNISNNKTSRDTKDNKIYVKRPDNLSEVKLSKDDQSFIDKHTITRAPKSETSTPRFGEFNKDGKIIRTQRDLINEAVERGLAENRQRRQNAVNNEQDMFNDMLYNVRYGSDKKNDTKDYEKNLKRVAKEYKINWKDLKKDVEDNFNKRESEIAKSQTTKETINRRLQNAKTRDQWDINFLEAVQNKPFTEQHITGDISDSAYKNKMLQEYKKYLEDPEKYWNSR